MWAQGGGKKAKLLAKKTTEKTLNVSVLSNLLQKKSRKGRHISEPRPRPKPRSKDIEPFALINIGLMKYVSVDTTTPVRGKSLPLKVNKDAPYAEVFSMATNEAGGI